MRSIQKTGEWLLKIVVLAACMSASAQQVSDPDFKPSVAAANWATGRGPVVLLDEAHFNFHTASGRYEPFAKLLREDGYQVVPSRSKFSAQSLKQGDILVISNALSGTVAQDWSGAGGSAFTDEEIASVRDWVREGGALFLVVDHMPMPAAAEKLGAAFGAKWHNGYAQDPSSGGLIIFRRANEALADHPITNGRNKSERVDSIATFAGSAFQAQGAESLLTFKGDAVSWMPKEVGKLEAGSPSISVKNWQQGAVLRFGKGRVALFGEAAMFSAQLGGPQKQRFGMNSPEGAQNAQFLLNTLHWLSGVLDEGGAAPSH